jgi:mannose-1-phosphate guanylyltransferase
VQAVVLVGGEGTRLRPLTSTTPKPVVPLVDRPFLAYMLEWLRRHAVDDVVMSMGYLATAVRSVLGDGSRYGVRIRYVEEPEPRGTAGALKYAESLLEERFFMLNGDVLTDLDLTAQLQQHERTRARATLALVPVEDPSAYGLVRLEDDRSVRGFVEKPPAHEIDTNLISAGAYVLERDVVELIEPDRNVSIEREVWPALVGEGLYACAHEDAYWMDIGTPERYLQATFDIVEGRVETAPVQRLGECSIGDAAHVDALAVLGDGVSVARGATVERSVVLRGAAIGEDCVLRDCIVGAGTRVGARTQITGGAVIGDGVTVGDDNVLTRGVRVFPHVEIPDGGIRF